jgi:hypothetical protein
MKTRHYNAILALAFFLFWACKNDMNFDQTASQLKFSADTIQLDTLYHGSKSELFKLTVHNPSGDNVSIPQIKLENAATSGYKINVDGRVGDNFKDVLLRANDSLRIFIEINPVAKAPVAKVLDAIQFQLQNKQQRVVLSAVVRDAEYYRAPLNLSSSTWDNSKARIIVGQVRLQEGQNLNIQAGCQVYFTQNSQLVADKNSQINIMGELKNEVHFRPDRHTLRYDTLSNYWQNIQLEEKASLKANYMKLFGAKIAINAKANNSIELKNSILRNCTNYGIYAVNAKLYAENTVFNSFGDACIGLYQGTDAELLHCSLANTSSLGRYAMNCIEASNSLDGKDNPVDLRLKNSILYSKNTNKNAVVLTPKTGQVFNYKFESCWLNYNNSGAGFAWDGNPLLVNCLRGSSPLYKNTSNYKTSLSLQKGSPGLEVGNLQLSQASPKDINQKPRSPKANLGAYQ